MIGTRIQHDRARIYLTVRTAHLERAHELDPAAIVFSTRRYDFDADVARGIELHELRLIPLAVTLLRSRLRAVEITEPLMRPGVQRAAVAVLAVRITGLLRRRRIPVVTYAIENRDPYAVVPTRLKGRIRYWVERWLSVRVARSVDRLAFGTEAAQDLYRRRFPNITATQTLIEALPAACTCDDDGARCADQVLFVGSLEARKGFELLTAAWPLIHEQVASARLVLVGKGRGEGRARELAEQRPEVTLIVDPARARIHSELRHARVLVLLSQRSTHWREQVGLPIVEGLAHGKAVVTTAETGLAHWLRQHRHTVLPADATPREVAEAIVHALRAGRPEQDVLADLPATDGRLAADRWLFAGV